MSPVLPRELWDTVGEVQDARLELEVRRSFFVRRMA
jgi:hypothetical protein